MKRIQDESKKKTSEMKKTEIRLTSSLIPLYYITFSLIPFIPKFSLSLTKSSLTH